MYKIKNTELDFESRIFHLHKIFYSAFSWAKMGFTSNLTYQDRNQGVKNTFTKGLSSFPLGDAYDYNGKINHEYITNSSLKIRQA